jgi:hypothetical protein
VHLIILVFYYVKVNIIESLLDILRAVRGVDIKHRDLPDRFVVLGKDNIIPVGRFNF